MLIELPIEGFSRVLASDSPAPGGGSVAALSGALGADLVSMVCSLSIGKTDLEPFQKALTETREKTTHLSTSLLTHVDLDTEAFNAVMAAFKLPKTTDEEKKKRSEAIQEGYIEAVQSPLGIARECRAVLSLAENLLGKSNPNALSDLGVAAQQAYAGLEGAAMNVMINIPSIKDEAMRSKTRGEITALREDGRLLKEKIVKFVFDKLS